MNVHWIQCALFGALAVGPLGCEPRPVVDGDDDDTTVIEERDTILERDRDAAPGTGVDVNVGGERGVDVDVNRDKAAETNPNP